MKAIPLITVLSVVFAWSVTRAQEVQAYKVWVTLEDESQVKGTLHAAREDEFVILSKDFTQVSLTPETITVIKVRRKGKTGRWALLGTAGGILVGGFIGYAGGDDEPGIVSFSAEDKAGIGAIIAAPVGALIGAGIGSGKESYVINGDKRIYTSFLSTFQEYASR